MKRFALAGNPNCGKTTLFNALTGSTAHVGNWPGVTVDKKEGIFKGSESVSIVDLPGIYSMSPYTDEEVVSRNYILDEKPDCVINIVDATNLVRNLYLTTQLLEMDVPVVIALNMMDSLEKQGDKIDVQLLEERIGVPVVAISAFRGDGIKTLIERAIEYSNTPRKGFSVLADCEIAHLISDVTIALEGQDIKDPLFHAIKLVENDEIEIEMHQRAHAMVDEFEKTFKSELFGTDFEALIADARYKYIEKHYSPTLVKKDREIKVTPSDKIDRVLTGKWTGIPIFLVVLFAIFHLTFGEDFLFLGKIFNLPALDMGEGFLASLVGCFYDGAVFSPGVILFNLMELLTSTLFGWITGGVAGLGASPWLQGLISDGILGGVGGVLSFIPQIVFLLLLLSILEDSGYMARIAFILDRIFRKFGVSGRAFIPMIMGFGCSVPAIINTRTLSDDREKVMTIRTIPFFTCGAKVPIVVAIAGAIAARSLGNADIITYSMYVLGIVVAVATILIMRGTTQRGEVAPFIMELPNYHVPSFKSLMLLTWDKIKHFLQKAFTIILISTIVIWVLSNFSWGWEFLMQEVDGVMVNVRADESILGGIGKLISPIFAPLGFGSNLVAYGWVFPVAAITGLIAKENVIATFGTLAGCVVGGLVASEGGVSEVMAMIEGTGIGVPGLIAFIVFNLTTIPCFATVATAKGELKKGKLKWTILFWVVTSYLTAFATNLVLTTWWTVFIVIALFVVAILLIRLFNSKLSKKA